MASQPIDVRYVARLARLELSDAEVQEFEGQLDAVIRHMAQLARLDLAGIEPTAHPVPVFDRVDPDEPAPSAGAPALLDNAPDQASGQVRVPKVVADA